MPGSAGAVSWPLSSSGANCFMTVCATAGGDVVEPDGSSTAGCTAPPVPDADVSAVGELPRAAGGPPQPLSTTAAAITRAATEPAARAGAAKFSPRATQPPRQPRPPVMHASSYK